MITQGLELCTGIDVELNSAKPKSDNRCQGLNINAVIIMNIILSPAQSVTIPANEM